MLSRIVRLIFTRFIAKRSGWITTTLLMSLFRRARRQMGRREVVDLSKTKPGDRVVIEHLGVSHAEQMKAEKQSKKGQPKKRGERRRASTDAEEAKVGFVRRRLRRGKRST